MTSFNLWIEPHERFFENRKFDCDEADIQLLSQAAELLGERAYACEDWIVRVRSDWSPLIAWRHLDAARNANIDPDDEETWEELPPVDMPIHVVDERAQGRVHRVVIRGLEPGRNFCSCADFETNALGTCKHIEFTLAKLLARRGGKSALRAGYDPPYSIISIDHGAQRHVRFRIGREATSPLRRLARQYFADDGRWKRRSFARFDDFVSAAKKIDPGLRMVEDVLTFVAEARDAERRAKIIDHAFPDGVRSAAFDELLRASLYDYQKQGALFAARAGRSLIAEILEDTSCSTAASTAARPPVSCSAFATTRHAGFSSPPTPAASG